MRRLRRQWVAFRGLVGQARKSRALTASFFAAAGLLLVNWATYLWKLLPFAGSPLPVPVHYSVLVGIDKFLPWYWMLFPALFGTGVLATDGLLAAALWRRSPPLGVMVAAFAVFLELLALIATVLIVLLNVGV